jgi:hypothetical protein
MRYVEFRTLLEYDRSKTIAAIGAALTARAERDSVDVDSVIDAAERADPTNNKQYVVWVLRQYTKNQLPLAQFASLTELLRVFYTTKGQHKRLNIDSDINRYDWRSLDTVAKKLSSTELSSDDETDTVVSDAKILYNGPLGILAVPQTQAASCELGSGTKWCTAAADEKKNKYNQYSKFGPLYTWHDKKRKQKYQFHFETGQFMDSQDEPLTAEDAHYFMDVNPVTKKLFQRNMEEFENVLYNLIEYIEAEPDYDDDGKPYKPEPTELQQMIVEDANFEFILHSYNGKDLVYYYKKATDELGPHIKKILKSDSQKRDDFEKQYIRDNPRMAQDWALKFYKGSAPHLEDLIAQDGSSAYLYAYHNLKQQPWPEAEKIIATNPWSAAYYAVKVLQKRWPAAEETIRSSPGIWRDYAKAFDISD